MKFHTSKAMNPYVSLERNSSSNWQRVRFLIVCAVVSRYKILCIQKCLLEMLVQRNILFDIGFLASMKQRKIQQPHYHVVALERKQVVLCCDSEETFEMQRTITVNHGHCEKQDF